MTGETKGLRTWLIETAPREREGRESRERERENGFLFPSRAYNAFPYAHRRLAWQSGRSGSWSGQRRRGTRRRERKRESRRRRTSP
jgi:hypothetical protein